MKFNWLVFILMAAVAGLLTYIVAGRSSCPSANHGFGQMAETPFLIQELELDAEQVRKIKKLHANLAAEVKDCRTRLCAARSRLGKALTRKNEPEAELIARINQMCQLYRESEMATLQTILRTRDVLDNEQRKRFDELISECTACRCQNECKNL